MLKNGLDGNGEILLRASSEFLTVALCLPYWCWNQNIRKKHGSMPLLLMPWLLASPGQQPTGINSMGLVQERRNSIANALELRLSCTNPSNCARSVPASRSYSSTWKAFNCVCHLSVEKLKKTQIMFSKKESVYQGIKALPDRSFSNAACPVT